MHIGHWYLQQFIDLGDSILQVVNFLIKIALNPIYSLVQCAFYSINPLCQLYIDPFLLFHKVTYHLAQVQYGLFHRRGGWWWLWLRGGTKLWFGTWGHIGRGIGFPGEVRVIPPIGIVGITIWSIRLWWFILTYSICIFLHQILH